MRLIWSCQKGLAGKLVQQANSFTTQPVNETLYNQSVYQWIYQMSDIQTVSDSVIYQISTVSKLAEQVSYIHTFSDSVTYQISTQSATRSDTRYPQPMHQPFIQSSNQPGIRRTHSESNRYQIFLQSLKDSFTHLAS